MNSGYISCEPRGSCNFRPGSNPSRKVQPIARATSNHTTKPAAFLNAVARIHLSHLFQDPFLRASFAAAEDDGLASSHITVDRSHTLDGGAAERVTARRDRVMEEV